MTQPPAASLLNPLNRRIEQRDGLPVMWGAYPVVGHSIGLYNDPLAMLRACEREVGPLFWVDFGFGSWGITCTRPDEALELFRIKSLSMIGHRRRVLTLFGESVLLQDGAAHMHQRTALNDSFTPRGIAALDLGGAFAQIIEQRLAAWPSRGSFGLLHETRELVLALIFRMVGVPEHELSTWRKQYQRLMFLMFNLPLEFPGSPHWFGARAKAWLDARIIALIDAARADPNAKGLIAEMVRGKDDRGRTLSDRELVDNVRVILLAGHETTASILAWMIARLAVDDGAWKALCDEALAASDIPRSPKSLRAFPYAEALFRETLRLYPPVYSDIRETTEPVEIRGFRIPAGVQILFPIIQLSRDPARYPDPDTFRPQRWLGRQAVSPLEALQFGVGSHFCLGYHVAWLEMVQVAVALARTLAPRGLRPRLDGPYPKSVFLPLQHPTSSTKVHIA